MAALTSASFVVLFVCSWIFVLCQGTQEVKVKPGEDATLQCQSHRGAAIDVIRWTRADLKPDDYILFFRNDGSKLLNESYRHRVELRDPEMKDGDASLILKNVTFNDTGTYECWIKKGNNPGKPELINTINLTVTGTLELKVTAGEDATLQCRSQRGANIRVIRWTRVDLKPDDYILFFRDGSSKLNETYRGRVELRDPEMKVGDASVILKNVNINDTGTYECWIKEENNPGPPELINTIKLTVTGVNFGLIVGLTVSAVLLVAVAVVGTMVFKKHRGKTADPGEQTHSLNPPTSV